MEEKLKKSKKIGIFLKAKYASGEVITNMKKLHKDFANTFHTPMTFSRSILASAGHWSISEIQENVQNLENPHFSACGSTGRRDGAPPVAIGSATKFRTFHHLSVLGLDAMQKI